MGRSLIYLDANAIIRWVEGAAPIRDPIVDRVRALSGQATSTLVASSLSRLECRCLPLRLGDAKLLNLYDTFFASVELTVYSISDEVIEEATRLRAVYQFKSPDAIHVAAAIVSGASVFITGDRQLRRCTDMVFDIV